MATAHGCHFFPFSIHKLYFLYVREALMVRSILLNSLSFSFFFKKIMSFKCVNLYVEQTFSRTSACGRSHRLVSLRTRQDLDRRVGPIMFSSVNVFKKEFTSAVTIMPQICHENQPPFCHFVMLTGSALFVECLNWPVFYAIGCLLMFVKLVRG